MTKAQAVAIILITWAIFYAVLATAVLR